MYENRQERWRAGIGENYKEFKIKLEVLILDKQKSFLETAGAKVPISKINLISAT